MTIKQQGGVFGRNPTFNDVDVDSTLNVGSGDFYVSGKTVGIGNTTPASLVSGGDTSIVSIGGGDTALVTGDKAGTISFLTSDPSYTGTYPDKIAAEIACLAETATGAGYGLAFYTGVTTGTNRAERLRIDYDGDVTVKSGNLIIGTSGKGIDFSATSGTGTSELFDDYEEGTFTPTLYGNSTAGTYELATASGTYTKVGRVVTAQVLLVLAGSVTGGGSGDTVIGGLPFTYDGSENVGQHSAVASGGVSFAAGATVTASKITSSDDNRLTLYESVAGASIATVPITDFGANDLVSFTVTYFSI